MEPTQDDATARAKVERETVMRRIRGLMAKAENNPSPEEALAASLKAEELLRKYNLNFAEVQLQELERGEGITVEGVYANVNKGAAKKISHWAQWLSIACAELFDVHANYGDGQVEVAVGKRVECKLIKFHGYDIDVKVCAWTFGYLFQQVIRSSVVFAAALEARGLTGNRMKGELARFREGMALKLCSRLRKKRRERDAELKRQQEEAAREAALQGLTYQSAGTALVVAKRAAIEAKFGEFAYPDSDKDVSGIGDAFVSGAHAGQRVNIDVTAVGSSVQTRRQIG